MTSKSSSIYHTKFLDTGKRIRKAFITLLDRMDYADISVTALCQEAQINRSTFYLHYQNIQEIEKEIEAELDSCQIEVEDQFLAKLLNLDPASEREQAEAFVMKGLNVVRAHYDVFHAAAEHPELFNQKQRNEKTHEMIRRNLCAALGSEDNRLLSYTAEFVSTGLDAVIHSWILGDGKQGCIESNDLMWDVIHLCCNLKTCALMNRKAEPSGKY